MKRTKIDFSRYTNHDTAFYPSRLLTPKTANKWNTGARPRPMELFEEAYQEVPIDPKEKYIVHWFRSDLRVHDNTALHHLTQEAQGLKAHPLGLYIISVPFWRAHLEGPFKIEFILQSIERLRQSLSHLNIPLSVVYTEEKVEPIWFKDLIQKRFHSNTVFFNIQYEYDELQRDISILKDSGLNCRAYHDQCVVKPGKLATGKGTQYSKFTPWYKKWKQLPYEINTIDHKFPKIDTIVTSDDFKLPVDFQLSIESPSYKPVEQVLKQWIPKSKKYKSKKDFPHEDHTSRLGPYLTCGELSPRHLIKECKDEEFVREVAFRDFYKHIIVNWPYLMMIVPFNFSSLELKWSEDLSLFEKWCLGETGFPFVDAAMRQLLQTGYMNNRCRMVVASFLSKDLGQDWRMGERWFHHHLIDADLSSNNGGWGWCSSTGVDAQPWFRIFNVYTQSEKFDKEGKFIKQWVPELKDVDSKLLHGPLLDVEGYPQPIVKREEAREAALDRYREALT